jgi:tetratricopeptide (TPR) repeat protein
MTLPGFSFGTAAEVLDDDAGEESGDFPKALDLFTQALAANPALPVTRRDLAMLHYELGDLSAAKDQLIDALRLAPDDAWSYVVLGNIFTREQDWDSAIRFFTKALDLKPGDPYALNGLGAATAKSGDEASAMRHFEAAIEANPHFPEPRFGKALLLKNQGHLDAAAETLESLPRDTSPGDARSNPVFQKAERMCTAWSREGGSRGRRGLAAIHAVGPCGSILHRVHGTCQSVPSTARHVPCTMFGVTAASGGLVRGIS